MMDYNFKVEVKEAGQRNKYGDSFYHYIIENCSKIDFVEHVIQTFCTGFLKPAISAKERKDRMNKEGFENAYFASYWTSFKKIGDRKYEYKAVSPSTH